MVENLPGAQPSDHTTRGGCPPPEKWQSCVLDLARRRQEVALVVAALSSPRLVEVKLPIASLKVLGHLLVLISSRTAFTPSRTLVSTSYFTSHSDWFIGVQCLPSHSTHKLPDIFAFLNSADGLSTGTHFRPFIVRSVRQKPFAIGLSWLNSWIE